MRKPKYQKLIQYYLSDAAEIILINILFLSDKGVNLECDN